MKTHTLIWAGAVAMLAAPLAVAAQAQDTDTSQPAQIVARDSGGRPTEVMIGGQRYAVCMNDQQDNCIEPYAAGFKWGDRPLNYWPGEPASEMHSGANQAM